MYKLICLIFISIVFFSCNKKSSWSDELAYQTINKKDYGLIDENRFNCIMNDQKLFINNSNVKLMYFDHMRYYIIFVYKLKDVYKVFKVNRNDIFENEIIYTLSPKKYYEFKSTNLTDEEIDRVLYLSIFFREKVMQYGYKQSNYICSTDYLKELNNNDFVQNFEILLNDTMNYIFNKIDTPFINCDSILKSQTWTIDSIPNTMLNEKIKELNNIKRFIKNEYNIDSLAKVKNNKLYYTIPELEIINFERIKQNDSITIQMTKINKYDYDYREKSWLIAPLWEYK